MTQTQRASILTNATKNSLCNIQTSPIKFSGLWDNYPQGSPCDGKNEQGEPAFSDQCAIRVGVALKKAGVTFKSYPKSGKCWFGHEDHILRAEELADWLKSAPRFCGWSEPKQVTGETWVNEIDSLTGIVFFKDYWHREGERGVSGDHIDLWNGSRLTASSVQGALTTIARFTLGIRSGPGFSDLGKAKQILFWHIP